MSYIFYFKLLNIILVTYWKFTGNFTNIVIVPLDYYIDI